MSPRELEGSPSVSPPEVCGNDSPSGEQTHVKSSLFGNGNGLLDGSIFPATLNNTDSLFRFTTKVKYHLLQKIRFISLTYITLIFNFQNIRRIEAGFHPL